VTMTITKTTTFAKVNDITLKIYFTIPTVDNRHCIRSSSLYITSVGNRCSKSSFLKIFEWKRKSSYIKS